MLKIIGIFIFLFLFWTDPSSAQVYQCNRGMQKISVDLPESWEFRELNDGCRLESKIDPAYSINLQSYQNNGATAQMLVNYFEQDMKSGKAKTNAGSPIEYRSTKKFSENMYAIFAASNGNPIKFIFDVTKTRVLLITLTGENHDILEKVLEKIKFN